MTEGGGRWWMRLRRSLVVLPPPWVWLPLLALYGLSEGPSLWQEWRGGFRLPADTMRPGAFVFRVACLAYGVYRVTAFHPFFRPEYRKWLETTPWTRSRPLPLGPVRLAWPDLVLIGVVGLLACLQPGLNPTSLLPTFLGTYLASLMIAFTGTGAPAFAYALAFGLGLVVRLWETPALSAWAAVLLYLVGDAGLHQSLGKFPWPLDWQDRVKPDQVASTSVEELAGKRRQDSVGWPFERLAPTDNPAKPRLIPRDAVLTSLLVGWWLYAGGSLMTDPRSRAALIGMVGGLIILNGPLFRLAAYSVGIRAPISLWGRLLTGRWIIPGFDQVLLTPVASWVASLAVGSALWHLDVPAPIALPVTVAVSLLVLLVGGPTLTTWRLTGNHRLVPGVKDRNEFVEVG